MTFGEALTFMQDAPFSRYPVYLNDLDNIIGLLHIKDALVFAKDHKTYGQKLRILTNCCTHRNLCRRPTV